MAFDDGLENLDINIVHASGFRYSNIIEEQVITFMYEKSHVTPIINNKVRYVTLTIILRLYQGIWDVVPVLLENLTLSGKHISRLIMRNDSHSVVLGRENVARTPSEVTAEGIDSLNQHFHTDGNVDISSDTVATRNLIHL